MATIINVGGGGVSAKPRKLLNSLANGSTVSVLEDGKLTQFYISHNYEPDLNGAGRTLFARKENAGDRAWDSNNVNAYASSTIDAWLNGDYKNMLSPIVKANMGVTTFKYTPGNGNNTVTNLARSVFLISVSEAGETYTGANVEGTVLPIAGVLKTKIQWTRSPGITATNLSLLTLADGSIGVSNSRDACGIYPCFTLPSDMALRAEPLEDGSWTLADEELLLDTETAKTTPKSGVSYTNGIADLTAEQLHEIGKAISSNPKINKETSVVYYDNGDVHRKISVGDTIDNSIDGATYALNIIGFNHDDLSLGAAYEQPTATGKAGLTIQMVNCLPSGWAMHTSATNTSGWTSCQMRTERMPYIEERLPEAIRGVIKGVKKLTSAGNMSATINTTDDKLFLLSEIEIFGTHSTSFAGEGSQYAYYKAGNSKIKKVSESASTWWERSPVYVLTDAFCCIFTDGTESNAKANVSNGVAFAYCI